MQFDARYFLTSKSSRIIINFIIDVWAESSRQKRVNTDFMLHYKVASAFSIDVATTIYDIKIHYALFVDVGVVHKFVEKHNENGSTVDRSNRDEENVTNNKKLRIKMSIKSVTILYEHLFSLLGSEIKSETSKQVPHEKKANNRRMSSSVSRCAIIFSVINTKPSSQFIREPITINGLSIIFKV